MICISSLADPMVVGFLETWKLAFFVSFSPVGFFKVVPRIRLLKILLHTVAIQCLETPFPPESPAKVDACN